jgi:N utilization substance protein A
MVVNELRGEKIDVVPWNADAPTLVANALQPAKVKEVRIDQDSQTALVIVPDYQLSLAIGKEGQNARLAARLTGWRIDIKSETQVTEESRPRVTPAPPTPPPPAADATGRPPAGPAPAEAEPVEGPQTSEDPEAAGDGSAVEPVPGEAGVSSEG